MNFWGAVGGGKKATDYYHLIPSLPIDYSPYGVRVSCEAKIQQQVLPAAPRFSAALWAVQPHHGGKGKEVVTDQVVTLVHALYSTFFMLFLTAAMISFIVLTVDVLFCNSGTGGQGFHYCVSVDFLSLSHPLHLFITHTHTLFLL